MTSEDEGRGGISRWTGRTVDAMRVEGCVLKKSFYELNETRLKNISFSLFYTINKIKTLKIFI